MTKLLDDAIARVRTLPEDKQDAAADALFAHLAGDHGRYRLSDDQAEEVKRIQERLRQGTTRIATDQEMEAFWTKCGL